MGSEMCIRDRSPSVPKAVPEDTGTRQERPQRTRWTPGRSPGSARRQFGDVSGAHGELSKHFLRVFFNQKSNHLQHPIEERTRSVFNSSKRMKRFASDQI